MSVSVVVNNISKAITEDNIKELFACVGNILMLEWAEGESENSCRITFQNSNSVKAALLLTGTPLGDRPLTVTETTSSFVQQHPSNVMSPAETIASLTAAAQKLNPQDSLDNKIRLDEQRVIARTVYVGNIAPTVSEALLRKFFADCGNIIYIKMAGNPAEGVKYAFMEFDTPEAARIAMNLSSTGAILVDRAVKVGPAMNAIVKPPNVAANSDPTRIESAMKRVEKAKLRLEQRKKKEKEHLNRKRSHSNSSSSSKSSRRDRHRSSRSSRHSKSRHSRRRHRESRSRSRSRSNKKDKSGDYDVHIPRYRPPTLRPVKMFGKASATAGLVWDGFQWTQPSGNSIKEKSENLATKMMDVIANKEKDINPSTQQAMVQKAHQQAALLREHMEKAREFKG